MDPKLLELLENIKVELLEKAHSPFKRKSRLGTTGAHRDKNAPEPRSTRSVGVTNDWDCHSDGSYKQICKGPEGRTKVVRINPGYKKSYNKSYKHWASTRGASKKKGK